MASNDPVGIKLLASLRRLSPDKVRVYDSSDETRDIAVPTTRSRWARVIAAIEHRPWVRCELLNKAGAVLGYVDNDGPAGDVEDLADPASSSSARDERMFNLILRAQAQALSQQSKDMQVLLQGCTEMMRVLTEGTRTLSGIYNAQVQAMADLAQTQAEAAQRDDVEKYLDIIEAIPEIGAKALPLVAGLRQVLKGQLKLSPQEANKVAPPQPNGAKP